MDEFVPKDVEKLEEEDKVKSESFIKNTLNFNKLDIYLSNENEEK